MTTDSMTTVDDATLFLGEAWSDNRTRLIGARGRKF